IRRRAAGVLRETSRGGFGIREQHDRAHRGGGPARGGEFLARLVGGIGGRAYGARAGRGRPPEGGRDRGRVRALAAALAIGRGRLARRAARRSEEHTSELQ